MNRLITILAARSATATIVLAGLAVRLAYFARIAHQPLMSDAASYKEMAAQLAAGVHFVPYWPPALPLYLAGISELFGGSEPAARLAMLPFYLGLCYGLYRLVYQLTSQVACANLALLPVAFGPGMICASVEPITELPTAMLLTLVACWLVGVKAEKAPGWAPLGIAIGCLSLLRPASLILLFFVPAYLGWRVRKPLAALGAAIVPALMVLAWLGYVRETTGQTVMINTANARNFYLGNNPLTPVYRTWWLGSHHEHEVELTIHQAGPPDPVALQKQYSALAWRYIGQAPGLFLLRTLNRACVFIAPDTYTGAYLFENYAFSKLFGFLVIALDSAIYCLMAVGSILYLATLPSVKLRQSALPEPLIQAGILIGLVLLYALPYFIAFSHPRYHSPMEPLLAAASSAFIAPLLRGLAQPALETLRGRRVPVAVAVALFLAIQAEFVVIVLRAGSA